MNYTVFPNGGDPSRFLNAVERLTPPIGGTHHETFGSPNTRASVSRCSVGVGMFRQRDCEQLVAKVAREIDGRAADRGQSVLDLISAGKYARVFVTEGSVEVPIYFKAEYTSTLNGAPSDTGPPDVFV